MILAVVGMKAEARLLPNSAHVVISGGDPDRLAALLEHAPPGITAVLSFGIAGGLDPALRPGALVVDGEDGWGEALARATGARRGRIVGAVTIIASPAAKAALFRASGALAVDLESGVAAAFAGRRGLPFGALRAVADTAHETLPRAAAVGLNAAGEPAPGRVLAALLRRPQELPALLRIAARSRSALAALARAVAAAGPGLARP